MDAAYDNRPLVLLSEWEGHVALALCRMKITVHIITTGNCIEAGGACGASC